ncbi:MAG: hypothetical protein GX937_06040 [Lentisphaerae bacterium]|jgi:division/cell wall cluster transcriptional repressor MraZ|nr:hypothetical protein [Lentisphaerota bacterium]
MRFNGRNKCTLDANGRIKLPPYMMFDFGATGNRSVVFYCLPEGCLGIFPAAQWEVYCRQLDSDSDMVLTDPKLRRQRRRIGAMSQSDEISNQGRVTIPTSMREFFGFEAGDEMVIVGAGTWVEVWKAGDWEREMHEMDDSE